MLIIFRFGPKRSGCELWSVRSREASCCLLRMRVIEDIGQSFCWDCSLGWVWLGCICEKSMLIMFRFGPKRSGCELWSGIGREASCWRLSMCIIEDI